MHIHGNLMNLSAMNPYFAAADRVLSSAQKAAGVRKKLNEAAEASSSSSPEEDLLVAAFASAARLQKLPDDEYHAGNTGKDSDFG